jgi:hypothetical protein
MPVVDYVVTDACIEIPARERRGMWVSEDIVVSDLSVISQDVGPNPCLYRPVVPRIHQQCAEVVVELSA